LHLYADDEAECEHGLQHNKCGCALLKMLAWIWPKPAVRITSWQKLWAKG